jgi:hypothetical protein
MTHHMIKNKMFAGRNDRKDARTILYLVPKVLVYWRSSDRSMFFRRAIEIPWEGGHRHLAHTAAYELGVKEGLFDLVRDQHFNQAL